METMMDFPELQRRFKELPPLPPTQQLDTWGKHRRSLRNHVATSETMDDFLRWSTVVATMFLGDCPAVQEEWRLLAADDLPRWTIATLDPGVGGAARLPYAPHSTGNLVHQAYHLMRWENATGRRVDGISSIVEFGGGYGAMALVCRQAGFTGQYTIFDLPEFSLLQQYYLGQCSIGDISYSSSEDVSETDLFIACYSISEVAEKERRQHIPFKAKSFLFAAADTWDGIDNNEWFAADAASRTGIKWVKVYNDIAPGHWYLFGVRQ